jgi:hypothetical protein
MSSKIYLRVDKDTNPDPQSYYDLFYKNKKEWGRWGLANSFETRDKAVSFLRRNDVSMEIINNRLVETEHGWQLMTPVKTLFGCSIDKPSSIVEFLKDGMYLQVWEGEPVEDPYSHVLFHAGSGNKLAVNIIGDLFIPVRMIACHKITLREYHNAEEFNFFGKWLAKRNWDINPFDHQDNLQAGKFYDKVRYFLEVCR